MFSNRFLQTAEMLKPSTPSTSHDSAGSSGTDDGAEYYPHIGEFLLQKCCSCIIKINASVPSPVFVQNKARLDDFCPRNLKNMHIVVDKLMAHSHLKYKGLAGKLFFIHKYSLFLLCKMSETGLIPSFVFRHTVNVGLQHLSWLRAGLSHH